MAWGAALLLTAAVHAEAQTPATALLVLEKASTRLDIVDPSSLKVVARVPSGPDPHEVIASEDGRTAYVSNYMGPQGPRHTLSVIDLVEQKALPPIDLGALEAPHGLDFAGGRVYFTAELSKAIGRYDPASRKIDWVMGTGQDRTHMVWVGSSLDRIVTSNVTSGTVSIVEQVEQPAPPGPPGRAGGRSWVVTNVAAGRGSEGFDVSPDGKEIWTGNARDDTATVIDVAARRAAATLPIAVKGANRLKFTPDGKLVLISGLGGGPAGSGRGASSTTPDLVVIDAASRKEVRQLSLGGGAAGILMDPGGSRAFVAVSGGNRVVVVDLKSLSVVGEIAPLAQPDGMAWAFRH
jgi:DNA-binding beta-propeller fold protein YncE